MGKYTWPIILIVVGAIMITYAKIAPPESMFRESKGLMMQGGVLVAIGGIWAVIISQSK